MDAIIFCTVAARRRIREPDKVASMRKETRTIPDSYFVVLVFFSVLFTVLFPVLMAVPVRAPA